ncbi:type IV pilus modification protein PilV [Steroidobacter cummioxidans]|uniref:type IV pilus modification protein PilV n=1 Tax=Steroidobacter cummioxidans TaxID=1803913 RepID=UPI000E323BA5|nr:type IV pilus modification protein PilV [Steroidobacter cummioxidans]
MRHANRISVREQAGVGLIEVLIALLVLSIGMLGMAGLQMWSLQSNQGAMERGMAVMQTHTIADAMRANRVTATNNGFNIEPGAAIGNGEARTPYSRAALIAWRQSLLDNLGEGATGGVACDGAVCTIVVRWQDRQPLAPADDAEDDRTQELRTVVLL